MFLPYFISVVLVGVIAFNLLNYDTGALNALIEQTGGDPIKIYSTAGRCGRSSSSWCSSGRAPATDRSSTSRRSWASTTALFEAAAIDGASAWQRIRYVILPSLKPTFIILLLFSLGGIMHGNFGLFWNLVGNNAALFATTDIIETVRLPHGALAEQLHDVHGGRALPVPVRIRPRHGRRTGSCGGSTRTMRSSDVAARRITRPSAIDSRGRRAERRREAARRIKLDQQRLRAAGASPTSRSRSSRCSACCRSS